MTVNMDDAGNVVAPCTMPLRAVRLPRRMLIVGLETEYRLVARSVNPIATIPSVLPGQTVQIIVQAVNDGASQGVVSEPVQFKMPVAAKKIAAVEPTRVAPTSQKATTPIDKIVIPSDGNGSHSRTNGTTAGADLTSTRPARRDQAVAT